MFKGNKADSYRIQLGKNIASGGIAGALTLLILYSLDYARTRLANDVKVSGKDVKERELKGLFDVYRKTLKTDGTQGLYRGFIVSCVSVVIYRGVYFGLYDTVKSSMDPRSPPLISFLIGYTVTGTAGLMTYPLDTIRRRMMMRSGQSVKYKGSIDCGIQIIKNEGAMSLMKGFSVNIVTGITGASMLVCFDLINRLYITSKH